MKTIFTIFLLTIALTVRAQISGIVLDEKKLPLRGAVIRAFDPHQQIKATLTDGEGKFDLARQATYYVFSYTGYKNDTIRRAHSDIRLIMVPDARQLNEVAVTSSRPVLKQEADRTIITVNSTIKKLASNVLEVINLAPALTVNDNEEAILMSGKSEVQVMINDKVVKLTPRDLAKMLKAMPVGSITAIEVMTNPPAKYEVNGNTGLINIRTNAVQKGINGNLDYSTSQGVSNWSDLSGLLNYGNGKFALNGYGGWHTGGYQTKDAITRSLSSGILNQQTIHLDKWNDPIIRLTFEYQLNRNSIIGGLVEREQSHNTATYSTDSQQIPGASYSTTGDVPFLQRWTTFNINYRFNDTVGNELTADLDKADYHRDNHTSVFTTNQPPLDYHTLTNININTVKTDYTHRWKNGTKLESGVKFGDVQTNDNQNGNLFSYRERIISAYASLNRNFEKWNIEVGLRGEQTSAQGTGKPVSGAIITKPDTNYLNILPAIYLTYLLNDKNNFRLSVNRRVKRPDYDDLQPITYEVDPLNYTTGNPGLRVQQNDVAELTYTYDNRISVIGSYTRSSDYFNQVIQQSGDVLYHLSANAGTMKSWNIDVNLPFKAARWWNMLYKLNIANDQFTGQQFQGFLNEQKWHYQLSMTQRINLPGQYLLQFGARFTSASLNLIYYKQSDANTTVSISKKFFNDQALVKIGASDLFDTQRNYTAVNFGTLRYTDLGSYESRRISLSLSWKFGNQKIRQTAERVNGDAEEKERSGK